MSTQNRVKAYLPHPVIRGTCWTADGRELENCERAICFAEAWVSLLPFSQSTLANSDLKLTTAKWKKRTLILHPVKMVCRRSGFIMPARTNCGVWCGSSKPQPES